MTVLLRPSSPAYVPPEVHRARVLDEQRIRRRGRWGRIAVAILLGCAAVLTAYVMAR